MTTQTAIPVGAKQLGSHRAARVRISPGDARGVRRRYAGTTGRIDARTQRHSRHASDRPGLAKSRASAESAGVPGQGRFAHLPLRWSRGEPDDSAGPIRSGICQATSDRFPRRHRRRQLDGLRQGGQFPAHQRRRDDGLQGLRQSYPTHAPLDRYTDDRRHRQRGAVLRIDRRRENPLEDGLRRSQGCFQGSHPRSGGHGFATGLGHRHHGHRRRHARRRVLRFARAQSAVAVVLPRGLALAGEKPGESAA